MQLTNAHILIALSFLIGLFCIRYIQSFDKHEKEPFSKMLLVTCWGGAWSIIITVGLYMGLGYLGISGSKTTVGALLVIGPVEEFAKFMALLTSYFIYRSEFENGEYKRINAELIAGAGNRTFQTEYEFMDEKVQEDKTYWYKLEDVNINGKKTLHNPVSVFVEFAAPDDYFLDQNYPNPFNPSTTISYGLPEAGEVLLQIFNVRGELVKELVNQYLEAGSFKVVWDATSNMGVQVPTGLYFAQIRMGSYNAIKKCLFTK